MNQTPHALRAAALPLALAVTLALPLLPGAAEIVVIVNKDNPASRMFPQQASQFFLGKSAMFAPIDQGEGSRIRNEFYQKVADKDPAQVKAIWAKLVFTGKALPPREVKSNAEVKKAVAADPKAIGYIDRSAVDESVKVVLALP